MEEEVDKVGGFQLRTPASPSSITPSSSLPEEMVFEVLLRLPIKKLHQFNCVSKSWQSLIKSPGFNQAYKLRHPDVGLLIAVPDIIDPYKISHFYYSTLSFHREPAAAGNITGFQVPHLDYRNGGFTEVINGLVCFHNRDNLRVGNVFTKEVMPLPLSLAHSVLDVFDYFFGSDVRNYFFGFDAVNGVYKLLAINLHSAEILTLGIGRDCSWRTVSDGFENVCRKRTFENLCKVRSFCIDGVLYWMIVERFRRKNRCYLVSFDLSKEEFRYIKVPRGWTSKCLLSHFFVKFAGRLALSVPTYRGGCRLALYVLEDGESSTWSKHSIPLPEGLKKGRIGLFTTPVGNLPDGQMLLVNPMVEEGEKLPMPVYSYDHQTCQFETLYVGKLPPVDLSDIQSACSISCGGENLTAFDVLFSGA